jgi:hypothetical protein
VWSRFSAKNSENTFYMSAVKPISTIQHHKIKKLLANKQTNNTLQGIV